MSKARDETKWEICGIIEKDAKARPVVYFIETAETILSLPDIYTTEQVNELLKGYVVETGERIWGAIGELERPTRPATIQDLKDGKTLRRE